MLSILDNPFPNEAKSTMHSTNEKKPTKSQGEFTSEYETGIFMWVINYFNLAWRCKEWGSSYYIDIK